VLLAAGSCVNARDNGGSTPLMCAAFGGYADVTIALLGSGADVEIRNFGGHSACDLAARSGLNLRGK
jgi:ankyrin repeat protein